MSSKEKNYYNSLTSFPDKASYCNEMNDKYTSKKSKSLPTSVPETHEMSMSLFKHYFLNGNDLENTIN